MKRKRSPYHHGNLKADFEKIAWQTVQESGADALSLRACARAAGVDPAAIYRHFKSKDDILNALVGRAFGEMADRMVEAENSVRAQGASQQLVEIGMAYVRYAMTNPHIFGMMFEKARRDASGAVSGRASDGRDAYQILQDGWARVQPDSPNSERFEFALWTGSHGLSSLLVTGIGPTEADQKDALARDVLGTILAGCLARANEDSR